MIERLNVRYENQGNYTLPCVTTKAENDLHIGVWAKHHRRYLKQHHRIRYYNLLTSEKLYLNLSDIEDQAENYFQQLVKSLAKQDNVTKKMKAENSMEQVRRINNIRNRAAEIVINEVIFK